MDVLCIYIVSRSHKKLARVGFEPTNTEFPLDSLTDWAIRSWTIWPWIIWTELSGLCYISKRKYNKLSTFKKLADHLCRRRSKKTRSNKTRCKRSFKVHRKFHGNTNCIRKKIQRTMNYLNDPFKNISNLSKKNIYT